jgi:HlyD family secretion protein
MKKQLVAGLVLVLVLAAVISYRVRAQNAYKHAPSGGSATVEGTDVDVATKIGGRLVEVLVDEGDVVTAGQVVAKLDCRDQEAALAVAEARVSQAEAQVSLAETGVVNAKDAAQVAAAQIAVANGHKSSVEVQRKHAERDHARATSLSEVGAGTAVELDRAETAERGLEAEAQAAAANVGAASLAARAQAAGVTSASAQVELAKTGLAAARAELDRAKISVAECTLVAPHAGTVTLRLFEPGAVVSPGARVLTLVDLGSLKARFFLPDAELSRAKVGAKAELRVDAWPGRVFLGKVRTVASVAEFTPRNVQTREDRDRLVYAVEISLDDADGALRPGMPGDVSLPGTAP